jgi:hypothetical protein
VGGLRQQSFRIWIIRKKYFKFIKVSNDFYKNAGNLYIGPAIMRLMGKLIRKRGITSRGMSWRDLKHKNETGWI